MQVFEQTYSLMQGGRLSVEQHSGLVKIVGWDQPSVRMVASTRGDMPIADRLEVEADSQGLSIRILSARSFFSWGSTGVDLEFQVPVGTPCKVEAGSGHVEVTGTRAALEAETGSGHMITMDVGPSRIVTGSGNMAARRVAGSLEVETGSGGVEIAEVQGSASVDTGSGHVQVFRIDGDVEVETGSGHLNAVDVRGKVNLSTGSGRVQAERISGPSLHVETGGGGARLAQLDVAQLDVDASSGRVEVDLAAVHPGGSYEIETGSGGTVVAIPPSAGLRLNVEASSGRIINAGLNLQTLRSARGELEAVLNDGRATLTIESGSGSVELRPYIGPAHAAPAAPSVADAPQAPEPPEPPAPPAPPELPAAGERLMQALQSDPALESSDQLRRVLAMVEAGKLTPEEAEAILLALDEEENHS